MNVCKRAFLYVTRKRGKTCLLAMIMIVISTLVLSSLASLDAEEKQSNDLRGATGSGFSMERNENWGDGSSGNGNQSMNNQSPLITDEIIERIAKMKGISGYNAVYESVLQLMDKERSSLEGGYNSYPGMPSQFFAVGSMNSEYSKYFLANKFKLVEGRHLSSKDKDGILISKDMAEKNGLKVGDTIDGINNIENDDPYVGLKVIGIFEVIADQEAAKDEYSMEAWYDYAMYVFVSMDAMKELYVNYPIDGPTAGYLSADFHVNDPKKLETIIHDVQDISDIEWDDYNIKANDEVFERTGDSMSDISSLIRKLILIIVGISMIIVTLILSMWMKSREHETGVLMAAGVHKGSILVQHLLEIFMIALVCFPLSYLLSLAASGVVAALFSKTGDVSVTLMHVMIVCGCGSVLLLLAIFISSIHILHMKPKEILSKMS